ncbi:VOC family protein [Desemzia sp. FAM 23991]|uniref:VOC family protein n=1 Tax=unclassified Desemzia TaxID=2685243 RepID=UPI0038837A51
MHIEHIALWVKDLEVTKDFYCNYFGAVSNDVYYNPTKGFKSYFLTFAEGARLELMTRTDVTEAHEPAMLGWAHLAISVGSKEKVDQLTEQLIQDGYRCQGQPRTTGDGYYESVIEDPEGNWIEITV